jgi:hypothetical protein
VRGYDDGRRALQEPRQDGPEGLAEQFLAEDVAVVAGDQRATMTARQVGHHGAGIRKVEMYKVNFGLANPPNETGAYGGSSEVAERPDSQHPHAAVEDFGGAAAIVGDQRGDVSGLLQRSTKVTEMGLDSARMRGVELPDLKDP